jgi:hypothetical protein
MRWILLAVLLAGCCDDNNYRITDEYGNSYMARHAEAGGWREGLAVWGSGFQTGKTVPGRKWTIERLGK